MAMYGTTPEGEVIKQLSSMLDESGAVVDAATLTIRTLEKEIAERDEEIDCLRDQLANVENSMLRRFDPSAAESTDLYTWITCLRAKNKRLLEALTPFARIDLATKEVPADFAMLVLRARTALAAKGE